MTLFSLHSASLSSLKHTDALSFTGRQHRGPLCRNPAPSGLSFSAGFVCAFTTTSLCNYLLNIYMWSKKKGKQEIILLPCVLKGTRKGHTFCFENSWLMLSNSRYDSLFRDRKTVARVAACVFHNIQSLLRTLFTGMEPAEDAAALALTHPAFMAINSGSRCARRWTLMMFSL